MLVSYCTFAKNKVGKFGFFFHFTNIFYVESIGEKKMTFTVHIPKLTKKTLAYTIVTKIVFTKIGLVS